MLEFRAAVERGDMDAVADVLADDVVFSSPAQFKPHVGKPITAAFLRAVTRVFEDFEYLSETSNDDGEHVLVFRARVGTKSITGCDILHVVDGKVDRLTVMVRPLSGLTALAAAMGEQFEQIQIEARSG